MSRNVLAGVLLGWVLLCGCINQDPIVTGTPPNDTQKRLAYIRIAQGSYLHDHQAPAKSAEDLKPLLAESHEFSGAPEKAWVSPRDGKPFVICWGVDLNTVGAVVWAYEQEGSGGSRYVIEGKKVKLLSDAEFRAAKFPPGHTPAQ